MPWLQLSLELKPDRSQAAEELLLAHGALSITLQDGADQTLLEPGPGELPLWQRLQLTALFDADAETQSVALALKEAGYIDDVNQAEFVVLADQVWERAWMDRFQPMSFGQRLWIYPSHIQPPEDNNLVILRLDPGLAFGSGAHPTTALCLEWIDSADLRGQTVVDYGCGSGVLAIAAALCGAREVWCVDHDPQALLATRENAMANQVSERVMTCQPDELPRARADVVLANILAGVLKDLAQPLCGLLRSGGDLVMSGLLSEQADSVRGAYLNHIESWRQIDKGEWALTHGKRRSF